MLKQFASWNTQKKLKVSRDFFKILVHFFLFFFFHIKYNYFFLGDKNSQSIRDDFKSLLDGIDFSNPMSPMQVTSPEAENMDSLLDGINFSSPICSELLSPSSANLEIINSLLNDIDNPISPANSTSSKREMINNLLDGIDFENPMSPGCSEMIQSLTQGINFENPITPPQNTSPNKDEVLDLLHDINFDQPMSVENTLTQDDVAISEKPQEDTTQESQKDITSQNNTSQFIDSGIVGDQKVRIFAFNTK